MGKIMSIVGTRPNFLKVDPDLPQWILHTGQHFDDNMSETFFQELSLPIPITNLKSTKVGEMIDGIEKYLDWNEPDLVIVYGDTNSSFAGAYAAAQHNILVAHVEAGLRSGNREMLEENNRILIDHLATFRFCPTLNSMQHLENEGLTDNNYLVGDVLYDRILMTKPHTVNKKDYILLTLHRAELVDFPDLLIDLFNTLSQTKEKFIFPVHPRTAKNMLDYNIKLPDNIEALPPQGYRDMVRLESEAKKIVTDSGGVQKEAYFLGVPCITVRNETEWPETIVSGWNTLATDPEALVKAISDKTVPTSKPTGFGDGTAFEQIRKILSQHGY